MGQMDSAILGTVFALVRFKQKLPIEGIERHKEHKTTNPSLTSFFQPVPLSRQDKTVLLQVSKNVISALRLKTN